MQIKMFSIFDSKAEEFDNPFYARNEATAKRSFRRAVNQEGSAFGEQPGDYTLFEIGVFETDTGLIEPHATLINHGLAQFYVDQQRDLVDESFTQRGSDGQ